MKLMSCNGCRALRKGCSEECSLRPCLQWINSPASQSNATLFLAKFYGRAGLLNLLHAGPHHLHPGKHSTQSVCIKAEAVLRPKGLSMIGYQGSSCPAIFKSLLYEACGRIINPINGSAGLVLEGRWDLCEEAVEAVLKGMPILRASENNTQKFPLNLIGSGLRHVTRGPNRIIRRRIRNRFKRSSAAKPVVDELPVKFSITGWEYCDRGPSHDSVSVQTVEPVLANRGGSPVRERTVDVVGEPFLELTLGVSSLH